VLFHFDFLVLPEYNFGMEKFDVLDKNGNLTGKTKLRSEVHRDGDWHRAVHIWIINSEGKLLVQKRSPEKESHPNQWDISAAGHVSAGDNSITSAVREIYEELGVKIKQSDFKYLFTLTSQTIQNNGTFINNEFDDVYLVKIDVDISKVKLQKEEVSEVKWINPSLLAKVLENKDNSFVLYDEEYPRLLDYLKKAQDH